MNPDHWPGSVRKRRNVVEPGVEPLGSGNVLDAADIWLSSLEAFTPPPMIEEHFEPISLEEIESVTSTAC